jgi:hypothetical protein
MSNREDISTPIGRRVFVGLSSIIQITPFNGQNALIVKGISFTTLEIGSATLSWGIGYPITAGEILSFNSQGSIYLAAAGSTATIAFLVGRSEGFDQT